MEEEERWFGRGRGDEGVDVYGGGGGGGDGVGGEVGINGAVNRHYCRTEGWCGSGR